MFSSVSIFKSSNNLPKKYVLQSFEKLQITKAFKLTTSRFLANAQTHCATWKIIKQILILLIRSLESTSQYGCAPYHHKRFFSCILDYLYFQSVKKGRQQIVPFDDDGFEPRPGDPIGLGVHRLNHSATSSCRMYIYNCYVDR